MAVTVTGVLPRGPRRSPALEQGHDRRHGVERPEYENSIIFRRHITGLRVRIGHARAPGAGLDTRRAEGVVSRKKQLLPVVLGLLER